MPKKPKILLVEDNRDDQDLALLAIESSGICCDVQVVHDGAEALELLLGPTQGPPDPPRLVVLDLKMPKVSGLDVLRAMRADPRTKYLPVVVLTSSGANSYIRKPIELDDFNQIMSGICSYWLLWNESPQSATVDRGMDDTPA